MERISLVKPITWAILILVLTTESGRGECPLEWRKGLGPVGVDSHVQSLTPWDPDGPGPAKEVLVVTGQFQNAGGMPASTIAAWNGAYWQSLNDGNQLYYPSVTIWNNTLIAWTIFNGTTQVWRRNADSWEPLGSPISGWLLLASFQGDLCALHTFTSAGQTHRQLERWNGATWQAVGAEIGAAVPVSLGEHNGKLILTGANFDYSGNSILQWNGITWEKLGGNLPGYIGPAITAGDDLIVSGQFTLPQGGPEVNVASWNGISWTPWPPLDQVISLAMYKQELYAGRSHHSGSPAQYIVRWDGTAWQPFDNCNCNTVYALCVFQDELVEGGFCNFNSNPCGQFFGFVRRWDGANWHGLGSGLSGTSATAFAEYEGKLIAGGIGRAADVPVNSVAQWDGRDWSRVGNGVTCAVNDDSLLVSGGQLLAGGSFVSGATAFLNTWDGAAWSAFGGDTEDTVRSIVEYKGDLVVGGDFLHAGGTPANRIARWDGTTWYPLGGGMDDFIDVMTVFQGDLIAGGPFTSVDGMSISYIAQWNGFEWSPLGPALNGQVAALLVDDDRLIVGGTFTMAGQVPANRIAIWDGSTWSPMGAGFDNYVEPLIRYRGNLYAGGTFTHSGGTLTKYLARWDGVNWQPVAGGMDNYVKALFEFDGDLVVGGAFSNAGGIPSRRWARYGPTGPTPVIVSDPTSPLVCAGSSLALHTGANGSGILTYQWRKDGIDLQDSARIWGTQSETLVFGHAEVTDTGAYDCVVILDDCGRSHSKQAQLTVYATGSADGNADGFADGKDISIFVHTLTDSAPVSQLLCAFDMTGDGVLDLADVDPFVTRLLAQ